MMGQEIVLFGGGGHAKVVLDAINLCFPDSKVIVLDDDPGAISRPILDNEVLGGRDILAQFPRAMVVPAIGNNDLRADLVAWLLEQSAELGTVIHPRSILSRSARVGAGSFVAAGAILNADAVTGEAVIVNTGASIDHDCSIGAFAHVAPGARLCGGVTIGQRTLVGTGAVILPGMKVGQNAVVGAGSLVTADVRDGQRVAGTPARPI